MVRTNNNISKDGINYSDAIKFTEFLRHHKKNLKWNKCPARSSKGCSKNHAKLEKVKCQVGLAKVKKSHLWWDTTSRLRDQQEKKGKKSGDLAYGFEEILPNCENLIQIITFLLSKYKRIYFLVISLSVINCKKYIKVFYLSFFKN